MAKTADTIALYSRKSRYTGKGESIGNQIDLCREYIRTHYGDAAAQQAVVFEDEGFSGGNLNRPDFNWSGRPFLMVCLPEVMKKGKPSFINYSNSL